MIKNKIMDDNHKNKLFIIKTLIDTPLPEEIGSGYYAFADTDYQKVFLQMRQLIKTNDTDFIFDLENAFQYADYQFFDRKSSTEEHRYIRQAGGHVFTYLKLHLKSINEPILGVREELPEYLEESIEGIIPKNQCGEWMSAYPYILKACIDYCRQNKIKGLIINILLIKFHPTDFKSYSYYVCTRQLLEKMIPSDKPTLEHN